MKISLIHPSRKRPSIAYETAKRWIEKSTKKNIEYILSIDTTDPTKEEYKKLFCDLFFHYSPTFRTKDSEYIDWKIITNTNRGCIDAVNVGAAESKNELIIVVSDDFDCFDGWDTWLLSHLKNEKDFIVKTSDGIQDWLITLPIMDRHYYTRFGYVYYPEYEHMFCDTEMTEVGHILGRVIDLKDKNHIFYHNHYCIGKGQYDEISAKNESTWNQGEKLFYERKQNNFPKQFFNK